MRPTLTLRALGLGLLLPLLLLALLAAGCSREPREGSGGDAAAGALIRVDVERPGMGAGEVGTGVMLPLFSKLERAAGLELVGGGARRGAATVFVRAPEVAAVEAALEGVAAMLPAGTSGPRIAVWQPVGAALVVEADQVSLERHGLGFAGVEQQLRAALVAQHPVTVESLAGLTLEVPGGGRVALGEVARIGAEAGSGAAVVVQVVAATHDVLRAQMDALSASLAGSSPGAAVTVRQVPARVEALEVRMRPEAMFDEHRVHFPELQAAIARFGRAQVWFGQSEPPVLLRQRPAPLAQAAGTMIEGKWGNAVRLDALAQVSSETRPEAYLRLPGGAFAGYLVVEGVSAEAVSVGLWPSAARARVVGTLGSLPEEHAALLVLR